MSFMLFIGPIIGVAVAIIAAEDEKAALKAMKLIKVKYKILEPILDFHESKDTGYCRNLFFTAYCFSYLSLVVFFLLLSQ